ncbi:type I restriction endonuclease subunit R [Candidatus Pelagibacter bacterium]|nr:type I restriction endonuclease subunit R [Candidatus Pelagibacter bacterium]MDA8836026.1 type I restriction endonuclease subunit R [Candidatus Pelagibacter bacterium]
MLISEEQIENQSLDWFKSLGYEYKNGYEISPDSDFPERKNFKDVILENRFLSAIKKINHNISEKMINDLRAQITNHNIPGLFNCNREIHKWITKGLKLNYMKNDDERGYHCKLIDYDNINNNDWLIVNQFEVKGDKRLRRPDTVVFVNGLPLSVIELKNPADVKADIWSAFNQLQTYKDDIPNLFNTNINLIISDGVEARVGSITADQERFMRWRSIDGDKVDPFGQHRDLETLIKGLFNKKTFLQFIKHFCIFEEDKTIIKKIAEYHQYHAVQKAVERIVSSSKPDGDKKGGVVWHTQGAGKSLEMTCLAGKLITEPRLENPTLLMVTDRQDLDGSLFDTFNDAGNLLAESPLKAESRKDLREQLNNKPSGGIIFTTIHKFGLDKSEEKFPSLTDRHNVVVICDEAHRTQYGFKGHVDKKTGEIKYGLAKSMRDALPNATFVAFTGTPISKDDRDTQSVFGNYVSVYDIQQAVEDGATVPIYYESRLAKISLKENEVPIIDEKVEEIFDDSVDDDREKERAKSRWAQLEAVVGAEPRIKQITEDLIEHFYTRTQTQPGKAMVVCMSREICVKFYEALRKLKPELHDDDLSKGKMKIVMSASASDVEEFQPHHTNRLQKKDLENRFKDPSDPLKIVIVRDMWLTGFDAPCLSTMYVDKPMQGANLAQAIARVNRVFGDKPGGLIVDYIGIAPQLKEALATYANSNGRGQPTINTDEALKILQEKIKVAQDLLHPVDWSNFKKDALKLLPACLDNILQKPDGKRRYCDTVLTITKAFALCGTMDEAMQYSAEVAFHQSIRAPLIKSSSIGKTGKYKNVDYELKQLVSESLVGDGVADVFKIAGLESPDISILSDEFLAEVKKMPQKNLAVELLQKLMKDEMRTRFKNNIVKQKQFSELLQNALDKYSNRAIEAAQVIEELIKMAKEFKKDLDKAKEMNLNESEVAFYDALSDNNSAKELMGDELLVKISREVAEKLRKNVTVDWNVKESVRAKLRLIIKNILKRYKYPPDEEKKAIDLVLVQAEQFSEEWAVN